MSLNSFSGINISKFFRKQRYKYFTKWVVAGAMLEVDRNDLAHTYELKLDIWNNIYNLVEDGYKYRTEKQNKEEN